ncbi:MAG: hypothetical protein KKC76_18945 [Proteobacteria bacterium]|nr:hypothetical protein [Pseudomonadota bacterium]MBU4296523.1 hypothetical protein [Pseudomonadota bacterium]MCG2746904.1 hypothetical protein [Desulfobulbaceae bacterium]
MKIRMRRSPFLFVICLVLSFFLISCAAKEAAPPTTEAPPSDSEQTRPEAATEQPAPVAYFVHTVTLHGESLSIIAKWYTGDLKNWEILAQHNPSLNPNRIFKGNQIRIPRDLMVREDAMTQAFVDESQPHAKRKTATGKQGEKSDTKQPTATPEGVPLFGPKDYSK